MGERVTEFDEAEFLLTPEDVVGYINEILAFDDPAALRHALAVVGRARGLAEIAPGERFESVQAALSRLGLRLQVEAA